MQRSLVFVDIDHVLSESHWRDPILDSMNSWDDYHKEAIKDHPVLDMKVLVSAMKLRHMTVVGLTSRQIRWYSMTNSWLSHNQVYIDELLMRPVDNYMKSPELKLMLVNEYLQNNGFYINPSKMKDHVALVFDDRADVIQAFVNEGITCCQVFARNDRDE